MMNNTLTIGLLDRLDYTNKFNITMMHITVGGRNHANALIVNTEDKTLERFEPHGWITGLYDWDQIEAECTKLANTTDLKYIPAKLFHNKYGPQYYDVKTMGFTRGYCFVWSLVYLAMRVAEPDMPLQHIYVGLVKWASEQDDKNNIAKITQTFSMMICHRVGK